MTIPILTVLPANGTKEAVFLLAFALIGRGSAKHVVVITSPAYPVYEQGARLAGAEIHFAPLTSAGAGASIRRRCRTPCGNARPSCGSTTRTTRPARCSARA